MFFLNIYCQSYNLHLFSLWDEHAVWSPNACFVASLLTHYAGLVSSWGSMFLFNFLNSVMYVIYVVVVYTELLFYDYEVTESFIVFIYRKRKESVVLNEISTK